MAAKMSYYKSSRFENPIRIIDMDTDPTSYPPAYTTKMQQVASVSYNGRGAWFSVRCKSYATGDNTGQVGNYYAVYFSVDSQLRAVINDNTVAAAPCPPFCADENPQIIKNERIK